MAEKAATLVVDGSCGKQSSCGKIVAKKEEDYIGVIKRNRALTEVLASFIGRRGGVSPVAADYDGRGNSRGARYDRLRGIAYRRRLPFDWCC